MNTDTELTRISRIGANGNGFEKCSESPALRQKQSAAVKLLTGVARGIKEFRDASRVVSIADFQPARQRVDGALDRITLTHRPGDAHAKAGDFFRDGQRDRRDAED